MPNVEHSFVLYALLLEPGGCLRAHITLFELVEPEGKKKLCLQRFWALQSVVLGIGLSHVMLTVPRVLNTVAPEGKSTAATMLYITKEGLRNWKPGSHFYTMDGAACHMHPSVCGNLQHIQFTMYIGPPNGTVWAQGCDKAEINQRFGQHVETFFFDFSWIALVPLLKVWERGMRYQVHRAI